MKITKSEIQHEPGEARTHTGNSWLMRGGRHQVRAPSLSPVEHLPQRGASPPGWQHWWSFITPSPFLDTDLLFLCSSFLCFHFVFYWFVLFSNPRCITLLFSSLASSFFYFFSSLSSLFLSSLLYSSLLFLYIFSSLFIYLSFYPHFRFPLNPGFSSVNVSFRIKTTLI